MKGYFKPGDFKPGDWVVKLGTDPFYQDLFFVFVEYGKAPIGGQRPIFVRRIGQWDSPMVRDHVDYYARGCWRKATDNEIASIIAVRIKGPTKINLWWGGRIGQIRSYVVKGSWAAPNLQRKP